MCADKVAAETIGSPFGQLIHGQARRVAADDAPGLAHLFEPRKEVALDVEIFDDGLDDPIGLTQLIEVIAEIAEHHEIGVAWQEERRRSGLRHPIPSGLYNFVPIRFLGGDVQQRDRNPDSGQQRGDAAAHRPCADDGGAANLEFAHGNVLCKVSHARA